MKTLLIDGRIAAYRDRGSGPPVVLVHCSSATHRQWSFAADALEDHHRVVSPDLFGYGDSAPWPDPPERVEASDMHLVEELVWRLGEPVHLVGHSYGGAVALEVARRAAAEGSERVRSLFLVEPVSFHLLRAEGRSEEWASVERVARRCIEAVERGDRVRASAPYMSFWLGRVKWWLAPRKLRTVVHRSIHKVAHEFRTMFELEHDLDEYRAIACPTTLVQGSRTRLAARTVTELLAGAIGGARVCSIPGAGHMSPFTHRPWLRSAILDHVAAS